MPSPAIIPPVPIWQRLARPESADLLSAAAAADPGDVAQTARLRKRFVDADLIHAALALASARRKGETKFGPRAALMWSDAAGMEMSSGLACARHKAARFAKVLPAGSAVADLCSGIGGDSIALSEAGFLVTAVDLDPARAWMTGMNAPACTAVCTDVTAWIESANLAQFRAAHLDPARRTASAESGPRRTFRIDDLLPGPPVIRRVIEQIGSVAVKLGPGLDFSRLSAFSPRGEVEIISERGRLTQAILWTGSLVLPATLPTLHPRTATAINALGAVATISGEPDTAVPVWDHHSPPRFIHEIDAAVERAELLEALCRRAQAAMWHPRLGLIAADRTIPDPFVTPFEVLDVLPFHERRLRDRLAGLNAGIVEVKTRDKTVDPNRLQPALRGRGDNPLAVFVLRFDRAVRAVIARRV